MQSEISNYLATSKFNRHQSSVYVVDVSSKKTFVDINGNVLLTPASLVKLITSIVALDKLSPDFSFMTKFFYTGKRKGAVIQGNLVIEGSGDPSITSESLWRIANDIANMGIKTINGDIVIDDKVFTGQMRDISRKSSEKVSDSAYDAPISAFAVNFNTIAVGMAPSQKPSQKARVWLEPYPILPFKIKNSLETTNKTKHLSVVRESKAFGSEHIVIDGKISKHERMRKAYRSVKNPHKMSGELVKVMLKREGVEVAGKVRVLKEHESGKIRQLLYIHRSEPLKKILMDLNHYSNNFIADMLLKYVGLVKGKSDMIPGDFNRGTEYLSDFLRKRLGIKDNFILKDGSGLNIRNRLSAKMIVDVLQHSQNDFTLFPDYVASLPAMGKSGSVRKRLRPKSMANLRGKIRAKTGTLTEPYSVSGLAGYLDHPRYGLLMFAIIQNGYKGKKQTAVFDMRKQQDRIMQMIFDYKA